MPSLQFSHRPFRGSSDLQEMIALVRARPARLIAAYPSIVDLQETAGSPEGQAGFRLWEDAGGKLAGFALLNGSFLAFEISPLADYDGLAGQMLAWAEEQMASASDPEEQACELNTSCREEDARRLGYLTGCGFAAEPVRTLHFRRSLDLPMEAPRLPEGFLIRPIAGEAEAEAWLTLHRAAHPNAELTLDFRLAMMRAPEYLPDLDLVAVAPDGRLAAYCVCHFSPEENRLRGEQVGYTDPLATHPDFQGRGLAKCLLLDGFRRLREGGMDFAEVSTWGENIGMIRTAESVGYQVYATTIFLDRPLRMA